MHGVLGEKYYSNIWWLRKIIWDSMPIYRCYFGTDLGIVALRTYVGWTSITDTSSGIRWPHATGLHIIYIYTHTLCRSAASSQEKLRELAAVKV